MQADKHLTLDLLISWRETCSFIETYYADEESVVKQANRPVLEVRSAVHILLYFL